MKLLRSFIVLVNDAAIRRGELHRMANDGAEHGLEIKSRADRLADLSQSFQFSNWLREFARPVFEFFKEPDVLYSNHGLIGERLQ